MTLNLCTGLTFNGQCEEAFRFYERCFGAKISFLMTWADSPMASEAPPGWGGKVMHATLVIGGVQLAGGDVRPEQYQAPQGFTLLLGMDDPAEAERIFQELSEGGRVRMPLQETFWAERFGEVTDRFGVIWGINCEKAQ